MQKRKGLAFCLVCLWWWGWWYTHSQEGWGHTAELGLRARIVFQVDKAELWLFGYKRHHVQKHTQKQHNVLRIARAEAWLPEDWADYVEGTHEEPCWRVWTLILRAVAWPNHIYILFLEDHSSSGRTGGRWWGERCGNGLEGFAVVREEMRNTCTSGIHIELQRN